MPRALRELVGGLGAAIEGEIRRLRYLGPLRSYPPRHLTFTQHHDPNWFAGGGYAWDIVRKRGEVRTRVNAWLGDANRLQTNYELVVRDLLPSDVVASELSRQLDGELHDLLASIIARVADREQPDIRQIADQLSARFERARDISVDGPEADLLDLRPFPELQDLLAAERAWRAGQGVAWRVLRRRSARDFLMPLLADYAITPDVFDVMSYQNEGECEARLELIREPILTEGVVRDLRNGEWRRSFEDHTRPWHRRGMELVRKLATQDGLIQFPSTLPAPPVSDQEWCTEALDSRGVRAFTGGFIVTETVKNAHLREPLVARIDRLGSARWWAARSSSVTLFMIP